MSSNSRKRPHSSTSTAAPASSITFDHQTFYADRFYLNAPTGISYFSPKTHASTRPNNDCKCQDPPPTFDRNKLINSLDLKAAIIGTYTLSPNYLLNELPLLFSRDESSKKGEMMSEIPTLVMHGVKGLDRILMGRKWIPETAKDQRESSEDEDLRQLFQVFQKQKMQDKPPLVKPKRNGSKGDTNSDREDAHIQVEVIEIDDDSNDEDEVEIVGCKKPISKEKVKMESSSNRQHTIHKRDRMDVSYLAQKHRKKLFQMPAVKHHTDDVDGMKTKYVKEDPAKNNSNNSSTSMKKEDEDGTISSRRIDGKSISSLFGEHVYFAEVESRFLPPGKFHPSVVENSCMAHNSKKSGKSSDPKDIIVLDDSDHEDEDDDGNQRKTSFGINPVVAKQRRFLQGTYHPKYMLLFEKSGAVVVVVSSANMTSQQPVDGSWIQRFEPTNTKCFNDPSVKELNERCDGSDFGHVLADYMQKQSEGTKEGAILPIQFLRKYIGAFETFHDFRKGWRFDLARVHLVSTVPGYYPGRFTSGHLNPLANLGQRVLYGPQRVADILYKLGEKGSQVQTEGTSRNCDETYSQKPWLPDNILSDSDRLVLQTTSFGAKWTSQHLEELVRQYMGHDDPQDNAKLGKSLLGNADILWPSMSFMESIGKLHRKICPDDREFQHFVFLQSQGLNSSDLAVCTQMKLYQSCSPAPLPLTLTPHIKTYSRLLQKKIGSDILNPLAWTMLSSACFSRGAQGFTVKKNNSISYEDERAYSNFELGILFVSRLKGDQMTDRLYASYPAPCRCGKPKEAALTTSGLGLIRNAEVIPMPFPFDIMSKSYQPDPQEPEFDETPFFEQMTNSSISSGISSLTPFGSWCKSRFSK